VSINSGNLTLVLVLERSLGLDIPTIVDGKTMAIIPNPMTSIVLGTLY
jgi:hypothetical protein